MLKIVFLSFNAYLTLDMIHGEMDFPFLNFIAILIGYLLFKLNSQFRQLMSIHHTVYFFVVGFGGRFNPLVAVVYQLT